MQIERKPDKSKADSPGAGMCEHTSTPKKQPNKKLGGDRTESWAASVDSFCRPARWPHARTVHHPVRSQRGQDADAMQMAWQKGTKGEAEQKAQICRRAKRNTRMRSGQADRLPNGSFSTRCAYESRISAGLRAARASEFKFEPGLYAKKKNDTLWGEEIKSKCNLLLN